jgi:hypothetical protein
MSLTRFLLRIRSFASAAGGDKPKAFFGITRLYSLRDRRIKAGPPQPRKVPFHRIGVAPAGTKYFCRDFKNPTTDISNGSFTIEYHPFQESIMMEQTKQALTKLLPGCSVVSVPLEESEEPFKILRNLDNRIIMERPQAEADNPLTIDDLRQLVDAARKF